MDRLATAGVLPGLVVVQSGHNPAFVSRVCEVRPFLKMEEFEARVAAATLVIAHAGAGTVVHALAAGRVPVVMPRYWGKLADCPPITGGCPELPPDMGVYAYTCLVAGAGTGGGSGTGGGTGGGSGT